MPSSLVADHQRFGGTYCLHLKGFRQVELNFKHEDHNRHVHAIKTSNILSVYKKSNTKFIWKLLFLSHNMLGSHIHHHLTIVWWSGDDVIKNALNIVVSHSLFSCIFCVSLNLVRCSILTKYYSEYNIRIHLHEGTFSLLNWIN